ncbi:MAG: acetyltransferase [Leptolyngbya sp. DLM2.Bin27]|nr:MAG: acetyltransferase [Leptolyngbya sp. DLM2.Bin27]
MAIRTPAVSPPQQWSSASAVATAQGQGQVLVESGVSLAVGAVVQADPSATVRLGVASVLQAGATVYGRSQGRVLGDDRSAYAVWVGDRAILTYKVLVQSPVYVGADCFIGFRSTLFNARLGAGCVVMMHALIQDVEVPPGKLVPSGSIITQQHQADALPNVSPADIALVRELSGMPGYDVSASGSASSAAAGTTAQSNERDGLGTMTSQLLPPDVVQRARQYLAQGLTIGTEHADSRRYRSGVWQTCSPIQSQREPEVMAALERCLSEHSGEYVRMFGIDPRAKQRVAPITIQRADGKSVALGGGVAVSAPSSGGYRPAPAAASGPLAPEVVQQVRQYLSQGYRIGTEHADSRRYSSNVWQTCSPIETAREGEVFGALERCLAEHAGEYVRMFGIDPQAKRRVAPTTIQRPDGRPMAASSGSGGATSASYSASYAAPASGRSAQASGEAAQQVRQWLSQGYHVGAEHADTRRYSSNVWQTCTPITSTREGDVMAAIGACMADHPNEYVRIFGIDPKAKRRVAAVTVQRPGSKSAPADSSSSYGAPSYAAPSPSRNGNGNGSAPMGGLSPDVVQQVQQLVNQGCRLSLEHADVRRYRSGAWQTGGVLEGSRASDVLSALESQLRHHSGQYVRLIGTDPRVKKRVLEATIQRP